MCSMKRVLNGMLFAVVGLLLATTLAGCAGTTVSDASSKQSSSNSGQSTESARSNRETITGFPGSYLVPDGWVKAVDHSTSSKYFYVEKGHENDASPDNISVEIGKNRYSADEHEAFREAIVRQLNMQIRGLDATLTGNGAHTDQGYVVYAFTIEQPDMVTTQFYIVGDQRYCLVHLTNFTGSQDANEAAQFFVDSFVWE